MLHEPQTYGIYVVDRRYKSAEESCQQLAQVKLMKINLKIYFNFYIIVYV